MQVTRPSTPQPRTTEERLREAIAEASDMLLNTFSADGDDAPALLRSLQDEGASRIRQIPEAAQKVLHLTRHPDRGISEVVAVIDKDPAMSQALLKYANSALMTAGASAGGKRIITPRGAVQRVGTRGVNVVVMAQLVEGQMCKPGGGFDRMAQQVWTHMVRTAPIARDVARAFRADPEQAYALGLLHDVGKLILFNRMTDLRRELRRDLVLVDGFVLEALRILHPPLAGLAFLGWGLGDASARAVAHHDRRKSIERIDRVADVYAQVVYLAEALDIAAQNDMTPDLAELWARGALDGDRAKVEDALRVAAEEAST